MTKTHKRPRLEIRHAQDNGPTPERVGKADYETVKEGKFAVRRKRNILDTLEKAGAIDGPVVTAANRWYADYVFSESGIIEIGQDIPEGYVKGDVHTFAIARGKAGERISLVRHVIGENAHRWLVFLLIRQFSLSAIGTSIWPELSEKQQVRNCSRQAVTVLLAASDLWPLAARSQKAIKPKEHAGVASVFYQRINFMLDEMSHNNHNLSKSNTCA